MLPNVSSLTTFLLVFCLQFTMRAQAFDRIQVHYSPETQASWGEMPWGESKQIESFVRDEVFKRIAPWALNQTQGAELLIHLFGVTSAKTDACPDITGSFDLTKKSGNRYRVEIGSCLLNDLPSFKAVLAHEIFHAIHTIVSPNQPRWYFEGLALLFEASFRKQYNPRVLKAISLHPHRSLTHNPKKIEDYLPEDYGLSLLYFRYLVSQCGGTSLFWELTRGVSGTLGGSTITEILRRNREERGTTSQKEDLPQCRDFNSSVGHFSVARFHNQEVESFKSNTSRYLLAPIGYDRGQPISNFASAVKLDSIEDWTAFWIDHLVEPAPVFQENHLKLYYIERQYPFRVTTTRPAESIGWDTVIMKTSFSKEPTP